MKTRILIAFAVLVFAALGIFQTALAQGNRARVWIECDHDGEARIYVYIDGYPWPYPPPYEEKAGVWISSLGSGLGEGPMQTWDIQPKYVAPHKSGRDSVDYRITIRFADGYQEVWKVFYRWPSGCYTEPPHVIPGPPPPPPPPPPTNEIRDFDARIVSAQGLSAAEDCQTGELIFFADLDIPRFSSRVQQNHYYHFEDAYIFEGSPGQLFMIEVASPTFAWWEIQGCPNASRDYDLAIVGMNIEPIGTAAPAGFVPTDFEYVKINVIVENRGTRALEPSWNYSGWVVLKQAGVGQLEIHDFARDNSSDIVPDLPNGLTRDGLKRSIITIRLYFWHPVQNGELEVVIRPADPAMGLAVGTTQPITVKRNTTEVTKCATFVVRTVASFLSPGLKKAFLDLFVAGGTLRTCTDAGCMIKAIVTLILKLGDELDRIVVALWTMTDSTQGEGECIVRGEWALETLKQLSSQGIKIGSGPNPNVLGASTVGGSNSPMATPAAPNLPPGVYVTAIQPQPATPSRNQGVPFSVTFVNTMGSTQNYNWVVLIFDTNTGKGFGETLVQGLSVPVGTTAITSADNWAVRGPGGCIDLFAQAYYQNDDHSRIAFRAPDDSTPTAYFRVC